MTAAPGSATPEQRAAKGSPVTFAIEYFNRVQRRPSLGEMAALELAVSLRDAEYTERLRAAAEAAEKQYLSLKEIHDASGRAYDNTIADRDSWRQRAETGEAQLKVATDMLTEIAEYETDWTFGAAGNVATLQQRAEKALAAIGRLAASPVRGSAAGITGGPRAGYCACCETKLSLNDTECPHCRCHVGTAGEDDHG